jgi:2-polyprenyl-3-methyl-5-hydroxy-6-metoxy-1,4-benzoquinol methylase
MTEGKAHPTSLFSRPPRAVRVARTLWRLLVDRSYRHMMSLFWWQPTGVIQPFNDTATDRYPRIFRFVRDVLGPQNELKILSFGCSTGEEVFSLRRYLPRATIKGVDINPGNIAIARQRLRENPDPLLSFEVARSTAAEPAAAYDVIFCMAVLRHGSLGRRGVTRCDHLIRFEDFATRVADFSRCLKPGGLLVIRHSNFRLCDARAGAAFETVLRVPTNGRTPLFGPDNRLMAGADYPDTVFRKRIISEPRA